MTARCLPVGLVAVVLLASVVAVVPGLLLAWLVVRDRWLGRSAPTTSGRETP